MKSGGMVATERVRSTLRGISEADELMLSAKLNGTRPAGINNPAFVRKARLFIDLQSVDQVKDQGKRKRPLAAAFHDAKLP
jgi:hypothetical protein